MTKEAMTVIAAGFKAGGKTGYAMPEQIASLRAAMAQAQLDEADIDKVVAVVKDSGLLNASATRQSLVKLGLLADKKDQATADAMAELLKDVEKPAKK